MTNPKFNKTTLCIFNIIVIIIDKFIDDGWWWIIEHQSCRINNIDIICWGVSPFPTYVLTLFAFLITCATLYYDYKYVKWYLCEK